MTFAREEAWTKSCSGESKKGHGQIFVLGFINLYLAEPYSDFGIGDGGKTV